MVIIFAVAFLIVGQWDSLRNVWDRLTTSSVAEASRAVSRDTEYFCPMDPGVISDWPAKCPVCNMALVRRKKGGPLLLPDGVVSRMQYSPYRLQLAGVRTAAAAYLPLARKVTAWGVLRAEEAALVADLDLPSADAALVATGQAAQITSPLRPGQGPWQARVQSIRLDALRHTATVIVQMEANQEHALSEGMEVAAELSLFLADCEPFRSQPTDPEPLRDGESRRVFVCTTHGDVLAGSPGKCPRDEQDLVEQRLADNQRLRYWCPMHPFVTATEQGGQCEACGGMQLVPKVLTFRPRGEVLSVPQTAIIDTGERQVVYVDRGDGMFEGVEVVAGPAAEGFASIASGLSPGERVATAGAFLLDAETRLQANAATAYFGATTNTAANGALSQGSPDSSDEHDAQKEIEAALAALPLADQALARGQQVCPVTQLPLGSMGKPEKLLIEGQVVFICCEGCRAALHDAPAKYLPLKPAPGDAKQQP
jgi:hypothetical protein